MSDLETRIQNTTKALTDWCKDNRQRVTPDQRVSEHTAAKILGIQTRTLQNNRSLGVAPPHFNQSVGTSRASFRIGDLARWIETRRQASAFEV